MPFELMIAPKYPRRQWALRGRAKSGKSHFAARMRGPLLVIDSDQRYESVLLAIAGVQVLRLSANPADNKDTDAVRRLLDANMPGSGVATIVVDSLTAILSPLVHGAISDVEHNRTANGWASWKDKAHAMEELQNSVTGWGTDTLWIYHERESRDAQGKLLNRSSLSLTEGARLVKSINAELWVIGQEAAGKITADPDTWTRRGIQVAWSRGQAGGIVWDDSGTWIGVPEKIDAIMYPAGLKTKVGSAPEPPEVFASPEQAIAWGLEQGGFRALQHARNSYEKLKRERNPQTAREMARLWKEHVAEKEGS